MPTTREQWITFWLALAITVGIVAVDVVLNRRGGSITFSGVFSRIFSFSPTVFVAFIFWLGVLVGHLMPAS